MLCATEARKIEFIDNEREVQGRILGGMLSAWSLGDNAYPHNKYVFPTAAAMFSDRVWNDSPCEYDEAYRCAVYSAVSGDNNRILDPYAFFGEILPPRSSRNKAVTEALELGLIDATALEKR